MSAGLAFAVLRLVMTSAYSLIPPGSDHPGAEPHQGALGERRPVGVQTVQHQLPAPVHHTGLDHLVVRDTGIGLQDQRQRQLHRRHRRLALRTVAVGSGQLGLEHLVEQLMAIPAQEHEQLRPPHQTHHRLLRSRRLHRRSPHPRTHQTAPSDQSRRGDTRRSVLPTTGHTRLPDRRSSPVFRTCIRWEDGVIFVCPPFASLASRGHFLTEFNATGHSGCGL